MQIRLVANGFVTCSFWCIAYLHLPLLAYGSLYILLSSSSSSSTGTVAVNHGDVSSLGMRWIQFVAALPLISGVFAASSSYPDLFNVTIEEILAGFSNASFSSVDLTKAYIARINETNNILHAVIEINPDALSIAADMDAMRLNGSSLGPLHGVPILIKDNIGTADKMNNTAGSYALLGATLPRDSTMAAKLRQAGAVILGKANLSQWANYRSSNSSNGWSARGGQTYGAYLDRQDPSGSSSGSAVGSSIGLAAASLGSETDGSIISPSQLNSVVGIKPTVGLTSRALVIPISSHQDTVGPIARTVKDAALLLSVIAGPDAADNYTSAIPNHGTLPDYVGACVLGGLRGARIGIPRQLIRATIPPYISASFEKAVALVATLGATVNNNVTIPSFAAYSNSTSEMTVLQLDFKYDLPTSYLSMLSSNPTNVTDLPSLINFTTNYPAEEYPARDIVTWQSAIALNYSITSATGQAAVNTSISNGGTNGILAALDSFNGSALMVPSIYASKIAAIAGYPIITIPLGFAPLNTSIVYNAINTTVLAGPGMPYGVSFIGRRFSEETLIRLGYAFEQATLVRETRTPLIMPTTQLSDVVGDGFSFRRMKRGVLRSWIGGTLD